jgi:uncharacterized phosphosugar-binding protein
MQSKVFQTYKNLVFEQLSIAFEQEEKLEQAAQWIAESLSKNGWIYICGTGHSHMLAEEIFYRAGGLARVIPILEPALMLHQNASKSTELERKEGYAKELLKPYSLTERDILLLASNSGRNAVSIELALLAKETNTKTIGFTNLKHSESVVSRHSSSKKLYHVVDLFLDTCAEVGDAGIKLEGMATKIGPTSTVISVALLQAILCEACDTLLKMGIHPEIFNSSNSEKGEIENEALLTKYKRLVAIL